MSFVKKAVTGLLPGFAARLRFPYLFLLAAALFVLDVLIPDMIPFVDEIMLGLLTLLLAKLERKTEPRPAKADPASPEGNVIDVEARREE